MFGGLTKIARDTKKYGVGAEFILGYSLRHPLTNAPIFGFIEATQDSKRKPEDSFAAVNPALMKELSSKWGTYGDSRLPRYQGVIQIDTNAEGLPVMPVLDLKVGNGTQIIDYIKAYLDSLYAHTFPDEVQISAATWALIRQNPANYYDTEIHKLPVPLDDPQGLDFLSMAQLANYLVTNCHQHAPNPLRFRAVKPLVAPPAAPADTIIALPAQELDKSEASGKSTSPKRISSRPALPAISIPSTSLTTTEPELSPLSAVTVSPAAAITEGWSSSWRDK
ncbi:hypothetical protein C8J56DRAFT_61244 [Mycena floridula]|nr:hypothetical protein C8J56DRAFT_61244 [Mycena floridula]